MTKRANLAAALHDAGAKSVQHAGVSLHPEVQQTTPVAHRVVNTSKPPSREGQRAVTVYVRPEAHKQLRLLSIEKSESVQELMIEALNDLFQKYGKSLIA